MTQPTQSQRSGLNRRPPDYESGALPLSYAGERTPSSMPWRGLEPRRLSAPPPQDGVSTSFTTRAKTTGPTGLEPATSRVTVECSNQTELRPLAQSGLLWRTTPPPKSDLLHEHRVSPRLHQLAIQPTSSHRAAYPIRPLRIARRGIEPLSAP